MESDPQEILIRGRTLEHWVVLAASSLGVLALVAIGLATTPDPRGFGTHEQLGLEPCRWVADWGIPCPGCGVTTAVSLFAHGRLVAAAARQPFGFALCAAASVAFVAALTWHVRGRDLGRALRRAPPTAWGAWFVGAALVFALAWVWVLVTLRIPGPGV